MKTFDPGHRPAAFWAACFALLLGVRLCHVDVLWVDEAYGMAAARRMLEGAELYRGIWFDKPPLYAWIYLLWGAVAGWPLRLGGALFALLCCWLAARTAGAVFGRQEGWAAAAWMAFFLSFGHPVAVIPLAPDLLLMPFALAAVWAAQSERPWAAGAAAAAGLLANAKAVALLPLLLAWRPRLAFRILGSYAAAAAAVWLAAGAWREPVWEWGFLYSGQGLYANPAAEGWARTLNLARILSLYYLGLWHPVLFEWAHLYIWQALIMLDALIVFLVWVRFIPGPATAAAAHAG